MAWQCSSSSNSELVSKMHAAALIASPAVAAAMHATDRAFYCPPAASPYEDAPQRIGHGATISAPHMHAMCLELIAAHAARIRSLSPAAAITMLDIGSGSGYITAATARLLDPHGRHLLHSVTGIDHSPDLVAFSRANFARDCAGGGSATVSERVEFVVGDGRLGHASAAPYDIIHVGAALPEALLQQLLQQVKPGGRLISPVEFNGGDQRLMLYDKAPDGSVQSRMVTGVRYIPMTDLHRQLRST